MRRKELEVQEKQLFAQRVTAAASVASAVAAHQQAANVEQMRRQMEVNAAREAAHQMEMAAQQRQMAEEQRLANFRNTVLTTLPLLKSEEEKIQYLTEQLLPKLNEEVDIKIYGPFELICFWFTSESQKVTTCLKNEAGLDLDKFLTDGNDLMARLEVFVNETEIRKKQAQELEKTQASLRESEKRFGIKDFFKIGLWAVLFFVVFGIAAGMIEAALNQDQSAKSENDDTIAGVSLLASLLCGTVTHFLRKKGKIRALKAKILTLTPKDDGSGLKKENEHLQKETELQKQQWETYKPKIVEFTINKFKDYINCDARALLLERVVTPQLESSLQEVQSFLPPSSRLPASHFAQFFFSESDVRKCEENQLNIKKNLELAIEPFYKNKTVVLLLARVRPDLVPDEPKQSDSGLRTVRLTSVPSDKKISVIKAIREVKAGLGLAEAKELSESVPVVILDSVSPQEAQRAIATLEMAGAKTELS